VEQKEKPKKVEKGGKFGSTFPKGGKGVKFGSTFPKG